MCRHAATNNRTEQAAMTALPLLTLLTALPLFGGIVVAGLDRARPGLARGLGLGFMLLAGLLALGLWLNFEGVSGQLQFVERYRWVPAIGAEYFVAVDGLGLLMVLLTAFVLPFALLSSWRVQENTKTFVALLLFLEAGLFGAFTALNFVHWFIFWELGLVPAYFLIKLWGGPQRREAATQFFVYTMGGSVTLLLGFLAMYLATGTFDFFKLAELGRNGELEAQLSKEMLGWRDLSRGALTMAIFGCVFLGFAVKVPVFPFHTWLPATYTAAPTGVAMVLTGVMSKMGVYGLLRIVLPIFPEQMRWLLKPLLGLAVLTIVASAFAALAQRDLKRLVAYSSINHLGYCLLGIFAAAEMMGPDPKWAVERAAALNGVLLQMFNHGVTASALFCFVGLIERRSGGLRGLEDFGGLRKAAPVFCGLMGITVFASLGLPGLNGFVGEFLIFKGAFPLAPWAVVLSLLGLLLTAVFLLLLLQRVFHGPLEPKWAGFGELTVAEGLLVLPAIALMFVLGLWPQLVLGFVNGTVMQLASQVGL
jgi:NADH-quinone oxidoreductase subunit M